MSSIITPGELSIGNIITIYDNKEKEKDSNPFGSDMAFPFPFPGMESKYAALMGIPLEVVAINLPYVLCKAYCQKQRSGPGIFPITVSTKVQVTIDTRDVNLMEMSPQFLDEYKKLLEEENDGKKKKSDKGSDIFNKMMEQIKGLPSAEAPKDESNDKKKEPPAEEKGS